VARGGGDGRLEERGRLLERARDRFRSSGGMSQPRDAGRYPRTMSGALIQFSAQ
jgi:hypothetical protein